MIIDSGIATSSFFVSGTLRVDGSTAAASSSLFVSSSGYVALGKTTAGKQVITIDGAFLLPAAVSYSIAYNKTGSVQINSNVAISGSLILSGSLLPGTLGTTGFITSSISHSLGNPKNVWYRLYVSRNSIVFVDNDTESEYLLGIDESGSLTYNDVAIASVSGSLATASYASSSLSSSYSLSASYAVSTSIAQNAVTASYISASNVVGLELFRIVTGSITASVGIGANDLFLIKSGSVQYFNISSSGNTTINSNLFIIKNFTTQQPVLTVSQSIVQFATQSSNPTNPANGGDIWFTSTELYVGLN